MLALFGIRGRTLRSILLAAVISSFITAASVRFLWPVFFPVELPAMLPYAVAGACFPVTLVVLIVFTFQENKRMKRRLDDVTAFTAVLGRGNLDYRMDVRREDDVGRVVTELNHLAETMGNQVRSLQRLADYNKELADKVHSAAIVEERQRLARELHDAVSQQLFALTMLSDAAAVAVGAGKVPEASLIRELADMAAHIQQEMRALLLHLRPVQLHNQTLAEGLAGLAAELEQKSGITIDVSLQAVSPLPLGVENHLFRIIQEALANVLRHAGASQVRIHLFAKEGELFLQISDNGNGFDPTLEKKASYGLKTMRERCEDIGGQISITSRSAVGTRIDIRVPLKERDDDCAGEY